VILEAIGATVRYPAAHAHAPALDGVSCAVPASRLVAVVGPNGSGKSSLVRALLGLVPLEAGSALVEGRPVGEWDRAALARTVGVLGQREEAVFPLAVRDMVMFGRYARLGPVGSPGAADHAAVDAALERCDVHRLADRRIETLSGGEWQRVRIARALAQEPRALVLDEPTAALDIRHEMELLELVRGLADAGMAALVVTHELNLAARFADDILLLSEGRVAAAGAPAEVFDRETLARVFEWPVVVTRWQDGSPQVVPLRPGEAP
jgi:iron complex transport system ATP-binding protein